MGCGNGCKCSDNHKYWDKDEEDLTKEDLLKKKEWLKKKMDWVEEKLKKSDK